MAEILQKASKSQFLYETFEQSMLQVELRPFAYIIDEETGYHAIARAMGRVPCEIGSISFANLKVPWTMLMAKEFRFKSQINYGQVKAQWLHNNCSNLRPQSRQSGFLCIISGCFA